jgi:D-aminopeptidase
MKKFLLCSVALILSELILQDYNIYGYASVLPSGRTGRPARARELGISPGEMKPGRFNAITDVDGVMVGHKTLILGDSVRTGVTAIIPHEGNLYQEKVPAAYVVGNGFGKLAGTTQIGELGNIETPIILTNTLSVGTAITATVRYTMGQPGNQDVRTVNPVVGETNDGYLNHIRGLHVKEKDVIEAIESASFGPVPEGCVGAGTGTIAFGFKGGIGTSSRIVPVGKEESYTVGVLVQTNYSGSLRIDGTPIIVKERKTGEGVSPGNDQPETGQGTSPGNEQQETNQGASPGNEQQETNQGASPGNEQPQTGQGAYPGNYQPETGQGSCMIIIATDAPLSSRNLKRLARRSLLGLARTGSFMSNGSGDYVVAFSTAYRIPHGTKKLVIPNLLSNNSMTPFFRAVVESVEEAVYNSMFMAITTTGYRGRKIEAIPIDYVKKLCGGGNMGEK